MEDAAVKVEDLDVQDHAVAVVIQWTETASNGTAVADVLGTTRMSLPDCSFIEIDFDGGAAGIHTVESFEHRGFQGILSDFLEHVLAPRCGFSASCQPHRRCTLRIRDPSGNAFAAHCGEVATIADAHASLSHSEVPRNALDQRVLSRLTSLETTGPATSRISKQVAVDPTVAAAVNITQNTDSNAASSAGENGCGVGRFELEETDWSEPVVQCAVCKTVVTEGERRAVCQECPASAYCVKCFDGRCTLAGAGPVPHRCVFESNSYVAVKKRVKATGGGIGRQIAEVLTAFSERPCLTSPFNKRSFATRYVPADARPYEHFLSCGDVHAAATSVARSLFPLLYTPSPPSPPAVVLLMHNCCEWVLADVALALCGVVIVPIDPGTPPTIVKHIVTTTNATLAVIEDELFEKFVDALGGSPADIKHVVVWPFDGSSSTTPNSAPRACGSARVSSIEDLIAACPSGPLEFESPFRAPDDIFTLIFTSGSTGVPKGAIQTHAIWAESSIDKLMPSHPVVEVIYRPLSYATDREALWLGLGNGGRVSIYEGTPAELFDALAAISPTTFSAPPRMWNILYDRFTTAVTLLRKQRPELDADVVERRVLRQFSKLVGHRVRMIGTGSAPIRREVFEFLEECFTVVGGIPVYESYGTTESGGIALNGYLYSGVEMLLRDVPEMGFTTQTEPKQGEICVISGVAMPGYWKNESASAALHYVDSSGRRWTRTGDIGEVRHHRLFIIDRIANLVKLSNGVFYSPEHLEGVLQLCHTVADIFVFAESGWEFPLAVVAPSIDTSTTPPTEELEQRLLREFREVASQRADIAQSTVPRGVVISPERFGVGNRLLTISLKLSRPHLKQRFREQLKALYESMTGTGTAAPSPDGEASSSLHQRPGEADSTVHRLKMLLCAVLKVREIQPSVDTAQSLGADSITVAMIREKLRADFGVEVPAGVVWKSSVADLAATIDLRRVGAGHDCESTDELRVRVERDISAFAAIATALPQPAAERSGGEARAVDGPISYLITGATGFIGSRLVMSLIRTTSPLIEKVVCVVRPPHATQRLMQSLSGCCTSDGDAPQLLLTAIAEGRLAVVESILDEVHEDTPPFPAALCKQLELEAQLDRRRLVVLHCAAAVNHTLPYSQLRAANVVMSMQLLALAHSLRAEAFITLSTASVTELDAVAQAGAAATVPQPFFDEDGYVLSKYVVERGLALYAASAGASVKVAAIRVGMASWDSRSGVGNKGDWIDHVARCVAHLGRFPAAAGHGGRRVVIAPVDWVADAILHVAQSALHSPSRSQTTLQLWQITSDRHFDLDALFTALGATPTNSSAWVELLHEAAEVEGLRAARAAMALFGAEGVPRSEALPQYQSLSGDELLLVGHPGIRGPGTTAFSDPRLDCASHLSKFVSFITSKNCAF